MAEQFQTLEDIFGEDLQDYKAPSLIPDKPITEFDEIFTDEPEPGSDEALAEFVGQEELGKAGLREPKLRGKISAADTIQEKMNEFKAIYPEGELVFVPGKGTPEGILEGVPSQYKSGEILFRRDSSQPFAKLDGKFFEGGGYEALSDIAEFIWDDLGVISGEILAGSKKFAKLISPFTKSVPWLGAITTGFDLWPLMMRMGIYGAAGELAQEGVQEYRGMNEQSFKEIADTAAFKGLIASAGTVVVEPIVRKLGNIFSGRGILKRSDESGEAIGATTRINEILKDLNVLDGEGKVIQISPLPANLLVDNPIVTRIGRQTAATGGLLSGQYREINEALAQALQSVGDEKSAAKLINLLEISTTLEKQRLLDIAYQASKGTLKFDTLNKEARDSLLQRFGVQDISQLKNMSFSEVSDIIAESVEAMTGPGGTLDLALDSAWKGLQKNKPDGVVFDLTKIKQMGTKESFGITQAKKSLDGDSLDLQEMILNSFGEERLAGVDTKIRRTLDMMADKGTEITDDITEQVTAREYKKYLTSQMGKDPLINIQQTNGVLENITRSFRDLGVDGTIDLPAGAGGGKVDIFDFLFDARKQLMDVKFAPIGNVTRDQRRVASQMMEEIDRIVKNPANADEAWKTAYDSMIRLQDEQLKLMNMPVVLSLSGKGNYSQLLKGYMMPNYTTKDISLLFGAMDDKGKIAFKQGFVNQLIGDANKIKNLPKVLEQYDRDVLKYLLDRPTLTSIDNLSGFIKKMDDMGFQKILDTQVQFGRAIDTFIKNNNTKGIKEALDFITDHTDKVGDKTLKGFDTPLGKAFHDGIINKLFKESTSKVKGKLQVDLGAYRKYIDNLKETGIFDTFDKKTQKLLEDTDLVKDFLVQAGDAGTSIEAASLADSFKGVISGRTDPGSLISSIIEIIGAGKMFTTAGGRWFLVGTGGKPQLKPSHIGKSIGAVVATLAAPDDQGISELAPILNILPFVENVGKTDDEQDVSMMAPTPDVSFDQPRVNDASRLASAFNPAGMMPTATAGGMNPQTMARGQQLFNKPGEITFANQGGIMSTNKAFQRVA